MAISNQIKSGFLFAMLFSLIAGLIWFVFHDQDLREGLKDTLHTECIIQNTPHPSILYEAYQEAEDFNEVIAVILSEVEQRDCRDPRQELYITYDTNFSGVILPDYLKAKYSDEITIILQHEYYDLSVADNHFTVTVFFNNKRENLRIPFNSISYFGDPKLEYVWTREALKKGEVQQELD